MVDDRISGTLAAAVTPLRDDGARLDEDAFASLLEFYGASGLDGVLVLGTTGEGIMLEGHERRSVAERAVAGAAGLSVVVHCGAQTTPQTCALAAHAAEVGADGVAVIAPPYFAFDEVELVEHFAAAAARVCAAAVLRLRVRGAQRLRGPGRGRRGARVSALATWSA